jgi:phosphatidylinositol alpha-1,6-mannosyltransferase
MRLLLLSSEFPPGPGGIGTLAYQLARNLRQMGWQVVVITRQDYASEREIEAFNEQRNFRIMRLRPMGRGLKEAIHRWRVISRWLNSWKPDIMLACGQRMVWLSALLARYHQKPWVSIGIGTEFGEHLFWQRALTRWSYQQADAVASISHYTRKQMLDMGIQPRKELVISLGADDTRFGVLPDERRQAFRAKQGFDGEHILLTVGNVTERKGQDIVIRAMPHVLERFPDTYYLVVGLPTKGEEFLTLAHKLGVEGHVRFYGRVDTNTLADLYNVCDIFIMTSRHKDGDFEGFGIAAVEAALCAKPAIVAANSGLIEAILPGETGLVIPEDDEIATAKAILALLEDEGKRHKMGKAARRRALREQTWEWVGREYHRLLCDLLGKDATYLTSTAS